MKKLFVLIASFVLQPAALPAASGNLENGAFVESMQYTETIEVDTAAYGLLRTPIYVPEAYGKLIAVVPSGPSTTMWFQSDQGVIRNVLVNGGRMVSIVRKGKLRE
jgi:hypothetical protein